MPYKILLTGGTGMVGRNILEHPEATDHDVLHPTSSELNLLDRREVKAYLSAHKPDLIIHAAGLVGGIQANMANPVGFLMDNLDMGRNLIGETLAAKVPRLLNIASSCMYPRGAKNPLEESMVLKGELEPTNEGYALAKIVATRLCQYISDTNPELSYKTLIPCNLYGRFDKFDPRNSHMLPAVIRKIDLAVKEGINEVDIWGDGLSRREFMYSGDLADFVFYAIERFEELPQDLNVGLGYDYTINEYYHTIADILGYRGTFKHDLTKPVGMKRKLMDNTKLKALGWEPKTSLEEGIRRTFEYYKSIGNEHI
ncbi:GDP-L-fucose synthase family protein [Muriicola marianensis]|uniref:GDP-L-fucose synthase n=1 Tax=Muriicola marianensis TaxID=1324801 RepID=A0ABQ1QWH9_9FLAO|nr:GDP-L-fucose synthase [Muriicola marianensis]GGD49852.1 GDP-L-fucose synthase [Muriicola marianensis]